MIGYVITDGAGRKLDGGQTRAQVVAAVQRLLSDMNVVIPKLPKAGYTVVLALPIGKYLGVDQLRIQKV